MLELVRPIKNPTACRKLLASIPLQKDISNYAKGRKRAWLFYEPSLAKKPAIKLAYFDPQIKQALDAIGLPYDLALLSLHSLASGSDARIKPHRDTTFAQPTAYLINIGRATFGYNFDRRSQSIEDIKPIQLQNAIYKFNCKHLHSVIEAEEGRISLVLWQLTQEYRYLADLLF